MPSYHQPPGNTNKNHSEVSSQSGKNGKYPKVRNQVLGSMRTSSEEVGMQIIKPIRESGMKIYQNGKLKQIQLSHFWEMGRPYETPARPCLWQHCLHQETGSQYGQLSTMTKITAAFIPDGTTVLRKNE